MVASNLDEESLFKGSVSASGDVLMQELPDEESIFLNLRTESYFGLDRMGTKMYKALVEGPTVGAAYERLADEFDVDRDRLRRDIHAFVERLIRQDLLEFRA